MFYCHFENRTPPNPKFDGPTKMRSDLFGIPGDRNSGDSILHFPGHGWQGKEFRGQYTSFPRARLAITASAVLADGFYEGRGGCPLLTLLQSFSILRALGNGVSPWLRPARSCTDAAAPTRTRRHQAGRQSRQTGP